jgi:hypothetical protein
MGELSVLGAELIFSRFPMLGPHTLLGKLLCQNLRPLKLSILFFISSTICIRNFRVFHECGNAGDINVAFNALSPKLCVLIARQQSRAY